MANVVVVTIQLFEYQTDMWSCRFDTLGKSTSAHPAHRAHDRWVLLRGGQGSISLEYQTYNSAHPFDTLVTGLVLTAEISDKRTFAKTTTTVDLC